MSRSTEAQNGAGPYATATNTSGPDDVARLDLLKGQPCRVHALRLPSTLHDERLARVVSRCSEPVNNQACVVTEKIWFNFEPVWVHWASLAVGNRTHRQLVKRKAANCVRRYAGMPRSEQVAVLAATMAVEFSWGGSTHGHGQTDIGARHARRVESAQCGAA